MMKKFFMPIFAALALTGCTDDVPGSEKGNEDPISTGNFLAVNIVSPSDGARSRAGESNDAADNTAKDPVTGYGYEDGSSDENYVTSVRLYFFSTSGDAVKINPKDSGNWRDIKLNTNAAKDDDGKDDAGNLTTIDYILQTVIMINKGEILPTKVVAIANPITKENGGNTDDFLGDGSLSLSQLQDRVVDYASYANGKVKKGNKYFIMSNSVYYGINGLIDATTISPDNYGKDEADAKTKPVDIYVERAVAKVRVDASSLKEKMVTVNDKTLYPLERKPDGTTGTAGSYQVYELQEDDTQSSGGTESNAYTAIDVYLKLDGWDVTADLSKAWLLKHIMNWSSNYLDGMSTWNSASLHRSFWADACVIPGTNGENLNKNQYYPYNDANHFVTSFNVEDGTGVYCNENAETPGELESTMILIKGTLCDANGDPLTIADYGGIQFVVNETFDGLKSRYLQMYRGSRDELPWRATTAEEKEKNPELGAYKQLDGSDFELKPAEYFNPNDVNSTWTSQTADVNGRYDYDALIGRYYVYARLTSTAAGQQWYKQVRYAEGSTTMEPVAGDANKETVAKINEELLDLDHAMIWNTGMTYYYTDIMHTDTKAGVVRNHIYDISIDKIYGLGTPVFDPDLDIIPEDVQNSQTFVAARVNILQWHVVTQHVTLGGGNK